MTIGSGLPLPPEIASQVDLADFLPKDKNILKKKTEITRFYFSRTSPPFLAVLTILPIVYHPLFAQKQSTGHLSLGGELQAAEDVLELVDVAQEPVAVAAADLGLGDVDHVLLEAKVQVRGALVLALQKCARNPLDLTAADLGHHQQLAELLGLDLEERGQLLVAHGGVQLEVRAESGQQDRVTDLGHEDLGVVLDRLEGSQVHDLGVIQVGAVGRDELGAGKLEELLKDGHGFLRLRQLVGLLGILLSQLAVNVLVQTGGAEGDAHGEESVHLVALLVDLVVLV